MVEHLKSGLSISTHVGCPMGCIYCVLSSVDEFNKLVKLSALPSEIVEELSDKKTLFFDGETPLVINNRTDPFLIDVKDYTICLLEELAKIKIKSPILLISKFPPSAEVKRLSTDLNILYFYSYSNIESDFNFKNVEKDLQQITEVVPAGRRFHYYRPIIQGTNDAKESIFETLKLFSEADFSGSVITGLRITTSNKHLMNSSIEYDKQHKFLKSDFFTDLSDAWKKEEIAYSIYRHTSCAIAVALHRANKLRYFGRTDHCNYNCKNKTICSSEGYIDVNLADIKSKLGNGAKFEYKGGKLEICSEVSQEKTAYIKNAYGIEVVAKKQILSPSEREIQKNEDSSWI